MKIAIFGENVIRPSGFGGQTSLIANAFADAGVETLVYSAQGVSNKPQKFKEYPVKYTDYEMMNKLVSQHKPDVYIMFGPIGAHDGFFFAEMNKVVKPYIWLAWESIFPQPDYGVRLKALGDNRVVHLSNYAKDIWKEYCGLNQPVIPHGVDTAIYKPLDVTKTELRAKFTKKFKQYIDPEAKIILSVDRNDPRKRHDFSFDILDRLLKMGHNVQLIMHCQKTGAFDLVRMSKMFGLPEGSVIFTDFDFIAGLSLTEMNELYNLADYRLCSSGGEGFGIPCWSYDTPINTLNGVVPIQDIKSGDIVLTHNKKYQRVFTQTSRSVKTKMYKIKVKGRTIPLEMTENHPMLILGTDEKDFQKVKNCLKTDYNHTWVNAKDLEVGNFLVMPINFSLNDLKEIDFRKYSTVREINGQLVSKYSNQANKGITYQQVADVTGLSYTTVSRYLGKYQDEPVSIESATLIEKFYPDFKKPSRGIPAVVQLDFDLGFMFGYYISQGSISETNAIEFASHAKHEKYRKQLIKQLEKFNLITTTEINGNKARTTTSSLALAQVIEKLCGKGARNKKIPMQYALRNREFAIGILNGMWSGDGSDDRKFVTYSTISKQLAEEYRQLSASLGYVQALYETVHDYSLAISSDEAKKFIDEIRIDPDLDFDSRNSKHYFKTDHYAYIRIESIESYDYEGLVYNMEVEDDQSYCVSGMVSHNCIEALASGCLNVVPTNTTFPELVGNNGLLIEAGNRTGLLFPDAVFSDIIVEDAVEKIDWAIKHPKVVSEMTARGVQSIAGQYDIQTISKRWVDLVLKNETTSEDITYLFTYGIGQEGQEKEEIRDIGRIIQATLYEDTLIDIGSRTGRVPHTVNVLTGKAVGYEWDVNYEPHAVETAKLFTQYGGDFKYDYDKFSFSFINSLERMKDDEIKKFLSMSPNKIYFKVDSDPYRPAKGKINIKSRKTWLEFFKNYGYNYSKANEELNRKYNNLGLIILVKDGADIEFHIEDLEKRTFQKM